MLDRHVLRRIKFLPFARGNEQILPIWREGEAMGEMTVARNLRNLPPDDFQVPDLCGFARLIQNQFAPANARFIGQDLVDRKSTRLHSSHYCATRMPSSSS